ncbi:MAG: hypothetical protein WC557_05930 [Ignavibacteriaceae bacterium]
MFEYYLGLRSCTLISSTFDKLNHEDGYFNYRTKKGKKKGVSYIELF